MRKKSMLTPTLRDHISECIRYYHEDRKQLESLKTDMIPSTVPKYEPKEGSSFNSEQRPTEDIAMRMASDIYVLQLEIKVHAIGSVLEHLSKEDNELVRLTYWNGTLTPDGIAYRLHMSKSAYYDHLNAILLAVAIRMGYYRDI